MTKEEYDSEYQKFLEDLDRVFPNKSEEPSEEYEDICPFTRSEWIENFEPKFEASETKFFSEEDIAEITDPEEIELLPTLEKIYSRRAKLGEDPIEERHRLWEEFKKGKKRSIKIIDGLRFEIYT